MATCKDVENAEEPWTAKILPLLSGLGAIDKEIAKDIFLNFITELCNETILLRRVSFRPDDISTIFNQKDNDEISYRFSKLNSREDVKGYKKKHNPLLLLNLTEVLPFIKFFYDVMPKTKLIHVVRNGFEVANDCFEKGWFSDKQLSYPVKALPYLKYKLWDNIWHIPWWVNNGEEKEFLSYSEYERCVYYWCQNIQTGIDQINQLNKNNINKKIIYEELLSNPNQVFEQVSDYLKITPGPLTNKAIEKIKKRTVKTNKIRNQRISIVLQERVNKINSLIFSSK